MKISLYRYYLTIALLLSHVMVLSSPFDMPYPLQCLQKPHGKGYTFNTKLIAITQAMRGLGLLSFYRITHKKKNLNQPIQLIQSQLKECADALLQEEHHAMLAIKNKFNLNDEMWNNCLTDINELKNIYKAALQQNQPLPQHDNNIPSAITDTLKHILANNAINPQSLSIKNIDTTNQSIQIQVSIIIESMVNSTDNKLIISKEYIPITINVFPSLIKNTNLQEMIALCAHEVQHIIQLHGLTDGILRNYITHYCSVDSETLTQSPEFQKFIQIQEAQAEILSAINDAEIARSLNAYRKSKYYPEYLYEEHFYTINTINMLWRVQKILAWNHHKPSLFNQLFT